jgi:hypothetical protein
MKPGELEIVRAFVHMELEERQKEFEAMKGAV